MAFENMIPADEFCVHHRIEIGFLHSLQEYGLIEMTTTENAAFLQPAQLPDIEKLVRLHYDLHINLEGLDAVHHLLRQMNALQNEMSALRNKLRFYEHSSGDNF